MSEETKEPTVAELKKELKAAQTAAEKAEKAHQGCEAEKAALKTQLEEKTAAEKVALENVTKAETEKEAAEKRAEEAEAKAAELEERLSATTKTGVDNTTPGTYKDKDGVVWKFKPGFKKVKAFGLKGEFTSAEALKSKETMDHLIKIQFGGIEPVV